MRIQVPVVVEMTDEQVADYAATFLSSVDPPRAKDIVGHVQQKALRALLREFASTGYGEVTIKSRADL